MLITAERRELTYGRIEAAGFRSKTKALRPRSDRRTPNSRNRVVIIFLVITFLLASTVPGLLRVRKRWMTSKLVALARSGNSLAIA